ncbi:MAG TPA: hypothetical protein VI793_17190 [Anaerolineales bacterium]|nr:hypothetical protein [Anaerolineales bacterium]
MAKDFTITISPQSPRADDFQKVFGTTTVCVKSPFPEWGNLPGLGRSLVYLLDIETLTAEQLRKMIEHIANKFGLDFAEVAAELNQHGMPILAEECTTTIYNPHKWLT